MNNKNFTERNLSERKPLDILFGSQLSSVEFVQDYVQLRFDGPYLTCYVWPIVFSGDVSKGIGDNCYRDSLCSFISREVKRISVIDEQSIELDFGDKHCLLIPLNRNSDSPPELVVFDSGEGPWAYW
jgi:hypothetical protein